MDFNIWPVWWFSEANKISCTILTESTSLFSEQNLSQQLATADTCGVSDAIPMLLYPPKDQGCKESKRKIYLHSLPSWQDCLLLSQSVQHREFQFTFKWHKLTALTKNTAVEIMTVLCFPSVPQTSRLSFFKNYFSITHFYWWYNSCSWLPTIWKKFCVWGNITPENNPVDITVKIWVQFCRCSPNADRKDSRGIKCASQLQDMIRCTNCSVSPSSVR